MSLPRVDFWLIRLSKSLFFSFSLLQAGNKIPYYRLAYDFFKAADKGASAALLILSGQISVEFERVD